MIFKSYVTVIILPAGEDEDGRPRLGLFDEGFYILPNETSAVLEDSGVLKWVPERRCTDLAFWIPWQNTDTYSFNFSYLKENITFDFSQ